MATYVERCMFLANSSGTGSFVVASAIAGYLTPAQAGAVNSFQYSYAAQTTDASGNITAWETGTGIYTVSTVTLTRSPTFSSNSNALVNFATAPKVILTASSVDLASTPGIVDVNDFIHIGGLTDISIQAAIDYAFNNNISRVRIPYLPNQVWTVNNPIFQDPPGNLRGSLTQGQLLAGQTAVPTQFGPNISVEADHGTRFTVTFQTAPAWWIGTGGDNTASGNHVTGVNLTNNSVSLGIFAPKLLPQNCVGFAIASGGATGTTFTECSATAFYCGFQTGTNNSSGALAEGNKWFYCATNGCYLGIQWLNNQSLVNSVFHCDIVAVRAFSSKGQDYVVVGGEHGLGSSNSAAVAMSNTSALTPFTDFIAGGTGFTNYQFHTTIVPDYLPYWTQCPDTGFVYDVATVVLPGFGIVPLRLIGFNTGTNVATYYLWEGWVWAYYGQDVALSSTDFQTQLQAATTLYACERGIYFEGPGHLIHCHYENNACLALWDTEFSEPGDSDDMGGGQAIVDELCMLNSNPPNPSGATQSVIQACQSFPWIRQVEINFIMRDSLGAQRITSNGNFIIEGYDGGDDRTTLQFVIERSPALLNANLRYVGRSQSIITGGPGSVFGTSGYDPSTASLPAFGSKAFGFGEWDRSYWTPSSLTPYANVFSPRSSGTGTTKYIGYKPAPGECQRITIADVASIKSPTLGTTLPICSRSMCIVEQLGAQTYTHVKDSAGDGFSYYANFLANWSYDGQTHQVSISGGSHANYFFNGLEIGLDNGGGTIWYLVTGTNIYQTGNGSITVYRESVTNSMLAGVAGSVYTGATVLQRTASLLGYGATVVV